VNNFPTNPNHGDIYEYKTGLLYQYDAGVNGWIPVVSNSANMELATPIKSGAMSSVDLHKLNRLVLPFPQATIIGNDCDFPFSRGNIAISSGDDYVGVDGQVKVRNLDAVGDDIAKSIDFQIHQHTYGFDFTLNLPNLVQDLIQLGQIKTQGGTGPKGDRGVKGDDGINSLFAGPPGDKGESGNAPPCQLSIETEPVSVNPRYGLDKALVDVRIKDHPTDRLKYYLEFDRQSIGDDNRAATRLNVDKFSSYWVVAVANQAAGNKRVYYLDVEPIISAIKDKYLEQIELLRAGYESITKHWVQTMSDLFDEQKAALCCALENCISKTKGVDTRQHMETTAAAVIPDGKIKINVFPPKGSPQSDVREVSNTRLTPGNDCYKKPTSKQTAINQVVTLDAAVHVGSAKNAKKVTLPKGRYSAIISSMGVKIDDQYGSLIRIQNVCNGSTKISSFLDQGRYDHLQDAKSAYEGLSLVVNHDGGDIYFYLPSYLANNMSGEASLELIPTSVDEPTVNALVESQKLTASEDNIFYCSMTSSHLNWYKTGWEQGNCCGLVIKIAGQDYIIIKRGLGTDDACGGGEVATTPCIESSNHAFKSHPSFAWPTLNGQDFVPIPSGNITFKYDEELNIAVREKIGLEQYQEPHGNPSTHRHLAFQLDLILFPTIDNG